MKQVIHSSVIVNTPFSAIDEFEKCIKRQRYEVNIEHWNQSVCSRIFSFIYFYCISTLAYSIFVFRSMQSALHASIAKYKESIDNFSKLIFVKNAQENDMKSSYITEIMYNIYHFNLYNIVELLWNLMFK